MANLGFKNVAERYEQCKNPEEKIRPIKKSRKEMIFEFLKYYENLYGPDSEEYNTARLKINRVKDERDDKGEYPQLEKLYDECCGRKDEEKSINIVI
jgi:hypothetical protein